MAAVPTPDIVEEVGLIYMRDDVPGIRRERKGEGFIYISPSGEIVEDPEILERIRSLAIPPAYAHVWISPFDNSHIQATGRDARGRKQYRYHPKWIELSTGNKFSHMIAFGEALPKIREQVDQDLCKHGLPREKVIATVVWFLENSLIRVGNEEYAKQNKSYGLTTMKMRHCKVEGSVIQFHFKGKKGIKHDIEISSRRMARLVKKIQELPGQELFQYMDHDGHTHSVTSADVNSYLKNITGQEFTAKDFRTWSATVMALVELSHCCGLENKREIKRAVTRAMTSVSQQLGNTPAICRKSYVHPGIVNSYLEGSLENFLKCQQLESLPESATLDHSCEKVTLDLLRELDRQSSAKAA